MSRVSERSAESRLSDDELATIARINAAFERENHEAKLLSDGDADWARRHVRAAADAYVRRLREKKK